MISVLLRDSVPRLVVLVFVCFVLYLLEPGFHPHDASTLDGTGELGPLGLSATLAYLAGLAMIVLLAGFVSTDRREGYTRLYFAHPTSPLALYGLRWALAFAIAMTAAVLFLVFGQVAAWGEFRGGWSGLVLPLLAALVYGGLMAFFSAALPRGDAWVVFFLFLPTFFPQIITLLEMSLGPAARQALLFVLPPQTALQEVWRGVLEGGVSWGAAVFAAGYGAFWLALGVLVLRLREQE